MPWVAEGGGDIFKGYPCGGLKKISGVGAIIK